MISEEQRERWREKQRRYYRRTKGERPEKYQERLKYKRELKRTKRRKAIEIFGGKCVGCGMDDYRCLQFDHINGNIEKERSYKVVLNIIKYPEESKLKYQLLCSNCNWIKKWEQQEWKYKVDRK